jgi:hypothetical protein
VVEVAAVISVAAVGALWKIASEHGTIRESMRSILKELQLLRTDLSKDILDLQEDLRDHEIRIRRIERGHEGGG